MKIYQIVSNIHKLSPTSNKAIYSHAAWLANGLVSAGHEVSLFASGDSETNAKLFSVTPTATGEMDISDDLRKNYVYLLISKCYSQTKDADIIHAHFSILNLFYSVLSDTPTLQSIHSPLTEDQKTILEHFKNQKFISFSLAQRKQMPNLNWVANIYHGVDMQKFAFNPFPKNYFLFLGRITEDKGVHNAIEAAKSAGVPLVIAGRSYPEENYWHKQVEPHIDGKMVSYIGELDFDKKIEWLKNARGLLLPVQIEEAFGMVMIEAMSCGTPVIAFNRGSIPEIVSHGKTGYVVKDVQEMVNAIKYINKIKREDCRKRAENFFSIEKMVKGYINIYKRIISEEKFKKDKKENRDALGAITKVLKSIPKPLRKKSKES